MEAYMEFMKERKDAKELLRYTKALRRYANHLKNTGRLKEVK